MIGRCCMNNAHARVSLQLMLDRTPVFTEEPIGSKECKSFYHLFLSTCGSLCGWAWGCCQPVRLMSLYLHFTAKQVTERFVHEFLVPVLYCSPYFNNKLSIGHLGFRFAASVHSSWNLVNICFLTVTWC